MAGFVEQLRKTAPCRDLLINRVGAEAIIIKNASNGAYVNGSRGKVINITPDRLDVELRNGSVVGVERAEWELRNAEDRVLASVVQFPIILGYALTIHRCQGMTLDGVVFDPNKVFERHQLYVALSRVRKLEDLYLRSRIMPHHVKTSGIVVNWYKEQAENAEQAVHQ
jgi:ATP-dependent exoDNAse (exonuclease V) alpha subunit